MSKGVRCMHEHGIAVAHLQVLAFVLVLQVSGIYRNYKHL